MAEKEQWSNLCTQFDTCALTGTAAFFAGIPDAEIVVNGPLWCYFYALRYLEKSDCDIAKRFHGTQPDNQAIVYGTEDCLLETLARYKKNKVPGVLLLENSCAVSLIGDDLVGIAQKAELDCPVICVDSGGLKGSFTEGYNIAVQAYLEKINFLPRNNVKAKTVNLLGCTAAYYNGKNDFYELKRILNIAGYKVIACPGLDSDTKEIAELTQASLNIVIHEELGLKIAEYLKDKYDMPFIVPQLPYGLQGTREWLASINEVLPTDISLVLKEIDAIEKEIFVRTNDIKITWGELWFDQVVVVAASSVAVGIATALRREWADMGELIVVLQDIPKKNIVSEDIDKILYASKDGQVIENIIKTMEKGLVLGSSNEGAFLQQIAKHNIMSSNIALPVCDELLLNDLPFMGIRGTKNILERLWNGYMQNILQKNLRKK